MAQTVMTQTSNFKIEKGKKYKQSAVEKKYCAINKLETIERHPSTFE